MKKHIILLISFFISYSIFANNISPLNLSIRLAAEDVVRDSHFTDVIKSTIKVKQNIVKELISKGGDKLVNQYNTFIQSSNSYDQIFKFYEDNNLDTALLIQGHIDQVAEFYNLYTSNSSLSNQTDENRVLILKEAFNLLKDEKFIAKNSQLNSVLAINEIKSNPNIAGKLSSEEALGCIQSAVLGVGGAIGSLIGTIIGIASGVGLTAAALSGLIRSTIRIGALAMGYGMIGYVVACIIWQAWD